MTVIDVNTGSYIGESNLEETVFAVNLAAAKEIVSLFDKKAEDSGDVKLEVTIKIV